MISFSILTLFYIFPHLSTYKVGESKNQKVALRDLIAFKSLKVTYSEYQQLILHKTMTNEQINEKEDDGVPNDGTGACALPGSFILLLNVHLTIEHSNVHICTNTTQPL